MGDRAVLQGAEVQANTIASTQTDPAKAGEVLLGASLSTTQTAHTEKTETLGVWQEMKGNGSTTQTANLTTLKGNVSFDPNLKLTVRTASTPDINSQLQSLSSQPGLAYLKDLTANPNVKWEQVRLANEQWSYSQQGLTPAGAALLSIAVAAATGGMGAGLAGTTSAMTSAAMNAGFSALASQAAVAMVNNGGDIGKTLAQLGSEQGIKNLLTAMATAGALEAINPGSAPTATGQTGTAAQPVATTQLASDFLGNLQRNVTNNVASSIIDAAINGKPLDEKALTNALTSAFITAGMAQGANAIGDAKADGTLNNYTQAAAHALLGCVAGAASTSGGCAAGAVGGVVGELSAAYAKDAGLSDQNAVALARTMSALAGVLAGGGGSNVAAVNVASQTGANAAQYNRMLHPTETQKAKELAAQSGGKYTAQQIEDALRNSGNKALSESVSTGMVVNVNDRNGVYDSGAAFTAGQDGKTIVQQLPNGGRVDAQLAAFIQAQTGGAASPYSWQDQQLGKVSPPTVDPNASIKMQTDPNWNYMGTKSAGMPSGVTTDNRTQSQIDQSLKDTATGIALLPAVGAAMVVAPEAAAVSGAVNSAAQVIKGQGFSPTEAAVSTIMGPVGATVTEAQAVKTVIEQGGKAALATNAGIGAATNVTGDTTAKILKGEEVTATGAAIAAGAGALGATASSKTLLQSVITEGAGAVGNTVVGQ